MASTLERAVKLFPAQNKHRKIHAPFIRKTLNCISQSGVKAKNYSIVRSQLVARERRSKGTEPSLGLMRVVKVVGRIDFFLALQRNVVIRRRARNALRKCAVVAFQVTSTWAHTMRKHCTKMQLQVTRITAIFVVRRKHVVT